MDLQAASRRVQGAAASTCSDSGARAVEDSLVFQRVLGSIGAEIGSRDLSNYSFRAGEHGVDEVSAEHDAQPGVVGCADAT